MPETAETFPNIYEYVLQEEQNFRTTRVPLASNWRDFNMFEHIDRSYTLKNSRFYLGNQDYTRPFLNIILPIANVNYRSEGFDVKDVNLYVDNQDNFHKSFVARKFHNWWAKENHIDTAIDESVESYFDYGLTLVKNVGEARPEVVQLQQLAFCDQTDIMSGPICLKHQYSTSELLDFKGKWKNEEIDRTLLMARFSKDVDAADGDESKTPGKYIEVYELHGMFPESWLGAEKLGPDWQDTGKYSPQVHIITYYISPTDGKEKVGITLFKGKESKPIFKALKRDPIYGRACGRGGIEELFHPQIWANYSVMNIKQQLETASKVLFTTNKKKIVALNNFSNVKHGQILDLDDNGRFEQLQVQPINKVAFDGFIEKWEQVARGIGSASDPQLGINPTPGTPLGTTEIVTSQGFGIHDYRRGKIAEFWQEIYRDWVLPRLQKDINRGHKWLDELSLDELNEVADRIATNKTNERIKRAIIDGERVTKESAEVMRETLRETVVKRGEKWFIEALKDELSDLPMDVEVNIVNKDKNLPEVIAKLNSVFRTLFTPGAIEVLQQNKGLSSLLNEIFETAGLSPVNFTHITKPSEARQPRAPVAPQGASPQEEPIPVTA